MGEPNNISQLLSKQALDTPGRVALMVPTGVNNGGDVTHTSYTFADIENESNRYAHGLKSLGVGKGSRVLLMVPPGFEMVALTYALFKTGVAPVMIDPGMGKNSLLNCVHSAEPDAMVAIPIAHFARLVYPKYFKSIKSFITVGRRWLWGGKTAKQLRLVSDHPFETEKVDPDDMAAILFTTGSTGPAKGVVYTHGIFRSQVEMIQNHYGITTADRDYPIFPLFTLFSVAMGMSVVIPEMDPTQPANADPKTVISQINKQGVTISFGSPAAWKNICEYCLEHGVTMPSLTRVLMAGAPVSDHIHHSLLSHMLPDGASTHTPFGSTEALPSCNMTGREVLDHTAELSRKGAGTCVGRPLEGMSVKIMQLMEGPVESWDESLEQLTGDIGEIVVSGPVVTHEYFRLKEKTALAKITDPDTGAIMHRMGDAGYLDEDGRVWFCGRINHIVKTNRGAMFTIPCEAIFNVHKDISRTALVGLGESPDQTPVIIAELKQGTDEQAKDDIRAELIKLGSENQLTKYIKTVLFHPEFPTDIRHNAKIFREILKVWADEMIKTYKPEIRR